MRYWHCIYTKPRQEKLVCKKLEDFTDIELFNPKLKRKKYVRSKLKEVTEQLFPCYVFAKFNSEQYTHMIRYTMGVRRFVGDRSGLPYIVDEDLIDFIKSKTENELIHFETPQLVEGEEITIQEGPFSGLEGIFVQELKANERVIILLKAIQYQAKVEIPKEYIVPKILPSYTDQAK